MYNAESKSVSYKVVMHNELYVDVLRNRIKDQFGG